MGIDTEQWRARIGTYNGGRGRRVRRALYQSCNAVSWTTGEILSAAPLFVQQGIACVSLWILLLSLSHWWTRIRSSFSAKLNREGFNHHKISRATVPVTLCITLVMTAAVLLYSLALLLIMAGDVDLNPGPGMGKLQIKLRNFISLSETRLIRVNLLVVNPKFKMWPVLKANL